MLYYNYNMIKFVYNIQLSDNKINVRRKICISNESILFIITVVFWNFWKLTQFEWLKHCTTMWQIRITKQHVSNNLRRSQSVISLDNGQLTASKETVNPNSGIGKCGRFSRNRVDSIEIRCKLLPLQPINARKMRPLGGCDPINHGKSVKDFHFNRTNANE